MPYGLFCAGHSVRNLWRAHVFPKWSPPTVAPNPYMRTPETPPLASDSLGRGSRFGSLGNALSLRTDQARESALMLCRYRAFAQALGQGEIRFSVQSPR